MDFRFLLCIVAFRLTTVAALDGNDVFTRKDDAKVRQDPYAKLWATSWDGNYAGIAKTYNCSDTSVCDTYAGNLTNQVYLSYDSVDFEEGAVGFTVVVSQKKIEGVTGTGRLYLHEGLPYQQAFAVAVIGGDTGGDQNWVEVNQLIAKPPTGFGHLVLTVGAEDNVYVGNIAYITFYKAGNLPFA